MSDYGDRLKAVRRDRLQGNQQSQGAQQGTMAPDPWGNIQARAQQPRQSAESPAQGSQPVGRAAGSVAQSTSGSTKAASSRPAVLPPSKLAGARTAWREHLKATTSRTTAQTARETKSGSQSAAALLDLPPVRHQPDGNRPNGQTAVSRQPDRKPAGRRPLSAHSPSRRSQSTPSARPLRPRRASSRPRLNLRSIFRPASERRGVTALKPRPRRSSPRLSHLSVASAAPSPSAPIPNPTANPTAKVTPFRTPKAPPKPRSPILLYSIRLLILGIGVAGIAGTFLSIWDPRFNAATDGPSPTSSTESPPSSTPASVLPVVNQAQTAVVSGPSRQALISLKTDLQDLADQTPGLDLAVHLIDLDTTASLDLDGQRAIPAASTIKVPILVAFLQDVDAGLLQLDESLSMEERHVATGSGYFQDEPPGTRYGALEVATEMIVNSDNTATNMLIERLGGIDAMNQRFREWGLAATVLRSPLPDLEGTNTTSPADLVNVMAQVDQGQLLSLRSRDRLLNIMQRTANQALLPMGISEDATIAHKTGDIGSLMGDVGLVDLPNGKRYVIAAMVQRPHNDGRAQELIRWVSQATHQVFSASLGGPGTETPPVAPPTALPAASPEADASQPSPQP